MLETVYLMGNYHGEGKGVEEKKADKKAMGITKGQGKEATHNLKPVVICSKATYRNNSRDNRKQELIDQPKEMMC